MKCSVSASIGSKYKRADEFHFSFETNNPPQIGDEIPFMYTNLPKWMKFQDADVVVPRIEDSMQAQGWSLLITRKCYETNSKGKIFLWYEAIEKP